MSYVISVLKKGKVLGKWTVRLPVGSVAGAASNPAHSSPQLGAPLWKFTSPPRASTAKTPGVVHIYYICIHMCMCMYMYIFMHKYMYMYMYVRRFRRPW